MDPSYDDPGFFDKDGTHDHLKSTVTDESLNRLIQEQKTHAYKKGISKKGRKPLGIEVFCQFKHCKPNTPAYFTCDMTDHGCGQVMCEDHMLIFRSKYPIGIPASEYNKSTFRVYSCSNEMCRNSISMLHDTESRKSSKMCCFYVFLLTFVATVGVGAGILLFFNYN